MDRTGCPAGLFTDRIMVYAADLNASLASPACDQSMAGWLTLGILLIGLRLLNNLVAVQSRHTRKSQGSPRAGGTRSGTGRKMSRSERTEYAVASMQTVYFILTSANVANTINSASGVLFALFLIPLAANHLSFIRGMIKLGRNIIPLSKRVQLNLSASEQSFFAALSSADCILYFLAATSAVCVGAILVMFVVGAAGFPGQFWPFEAAFFLIPTYQASAMLMAVWQVQRCKAALQRLLAENMMSGSIKDSVEAAVTSMLLQQLVIMAFTGPVFALCALFAVGVIPLYWWLLCVVFFGSDTLMVFAVNVLPRCRRKHSASQSGTSNNEVVVVHMSGGESLPPQST